MTVEVESKAIYDCIIVGGGISGISFAHYLNRGDKSVLILEKAENIGGQIQTLYSESKIGYWFEMGAHTCYNSYTNLLSIVKETGGEKLIQPLEKYGYVLYSENKIKSLFSGISILPFILNMPKYFFSDKKGKTVREFFGPIVGAPNYDRLFTNAFKAVISQNADDYPAEIFLKKRKDKEKELPRRFTFTNGLSHFLKHIIEKDNLKVNTSSVVVSIEEKHNADKTLFKITTKEGNCYYAYSIALATEPPTAAKLLKDIEPTLCDLLSSIPLFSSESINITIEKDKLNLKEIAGIIPLSNDFLSAVSRDLVEDEKLRSFTFHFEKGKKNDNEKLNLICKILNISHSDIIEMKSTIHILPSMRMEHLGMNERVKISKQNPNIYILGNYFYGLSLEDCVNRSIDESKIFLEGAN